MAAFGQGLSLPSALEQGPRAEFGLIRPVNNEIVTAGFQQPDKDSKKKKPAVADKEGGVLLYAIPVTPPSADRLFRLDSEEVFRDRLRAEVRQRSATVQLEFPNSDPLVVRREPQRPWPEYVKWVEPNYVVSKRLFFEQPRFESYGQSLGVLQPAVSTGIFCFDLMLWPARRMAHPFQCYQVNTDCYSPYFHLVGE